MRVAWWPDLGGLPLDRRVRAVLDSQRRTFEDLGCIVEEATPDLSGADEVFLTTRAWRVWSMLGPFLAKHRDEMKPEAIGEIERGARLSAGDVARALVLHGEIMERMRRFQEKYEFLLCAVNQVPPFDATIDWPKEIEGVAMDGYIAWMRSAYWITTTFRPAISVPAGFTPEGLPVGIQIVGRYRDDLGVLRIGHMFEQATGVGRRHPSISSASLSTEPEREQPGEHRGLHSWRRRWWRSLHPRARERRSAGRRRPCRSRRTRRTGG